MPTMLARRAALRTILTAPAVLALAALGVRAARSAPIGATEIRTMQGSSQWINDPLVAVDVYDGHLRYGEDDLLPVDYPGPRSFEEGSYAPDLEPLVLKPDPDAPIFQLARNIP